MEKQPFAYFLLLLIISIPIWLVGGEKLPVPVDLPVSSLQSLVPAVAASILIYRQDGLEGVKALFKQTFDYEKIRDKHWIAPALLANPLIYSVSYAILRVSGGALPKPVKVRWLLAPVFAVIYFPFAVMEELGWTGYALEPLQKQWGAFKASILIGLVWAFWHLAPDVQNRKPVRWILWHRLGTVATRVFMVWFYNRSGKSVFSSILLHDTNNVSWTLFPNYGSHYNPKITSLVTLLAAAVAIFISRPKP
jgi:membrane protease YdiL (CAAX protease family)